MSAAQDVEAGDGTTSVVVLAGSLLGAAQKMLSKGIHPTTIAESFQRASHKANEFLTDVATPLDLSDRESLLKSASTSLNSKIVSQYSGLFAPIAVDAVLKVIDPATAINVDLKDIRIVKKVGGTIDDTELVDGLVLAQNVVKSAGGPTRIEKAKIGLIQFQLSPPKPDVSIQRYFSFSIFNSKDQVTDTRILYIGGFYNIDGEPDYRQRLPPDGQDSQGGASILA